MEYKSIFHAGDKNHFSVITSKVSAFSYSVESKSLNIWVSGDNDNFVCRYDSVEELMSNVERLEQAIDIATL